jgi:hypothetical protein
VGELHATYDETKKSYSFLTTAEEMQFERVYGFKGPQVSRYSYPGDFRVVMINNQKTVVVNNFRDLVNWVRNDATGSY